MRSDSPRSLTRFRFSRRTGDRLLFAGGGLIVGILLTLVLLVALAPAPTVPASTPSSATDLSITVDDAYLTAQVADAIAHANLPITLSRIHCHINTSDTLTMSASADVIPGLLVRTLVAQARIYVANGSLAIKFTSATFGGLQIPSFLDGALQDNVNTQLSAAFPQISSGTTKYMITTVNSTPGYLMIGFGKAA